MSYKVIFTNSNGNPVKEDGSLYLNNEQDQKAKLFDSFEQAKENIDIFLHNFPEHEAVLYSGKDLEQFKIY